VLRVTADTNILISALIFPGGKPFQLLELAREGKINLTVSSAILDEMGACLPENSIGRLRISPMRGGGLPL
jgi:putative PIN family toxin of toxin-antitoxin system